MKTNDNIFEGDVVPPSQEEVVVVQETQPQPQMEEGGVVDDGLVKVDWGLIFTFFK